MTLVPVQGSIMLEANAGASFRRVDAKFGGALVITGPYGGHRYEADQAYLRTGYERRMAGWPGYGHFNYAAKPRQSNHEGKAPEWEGFAVDISNYRLFPGLHAAMVAEGWVRDPIELWHYNYTGKRTQIVGVAGNVISITPTPIAPEPEEESDMAKIIVRNKEFAGVAGQKMNESQVSFWIVGVAPAGKPVIEVTTNEGRINDMLKARGNTIVKGSDHESLPILTYGELFSFLETEVGFENPKNDNMFISGWKWIPGVDPVAVFNGDIDQTEAAQIVAALSKVVTDAVATIKFPTKFVASN